MSERNVHRPNYEEMDGGREDDSKSDSDDESRATRRCMVSTDKGNNGTVSEAVSSAEPPRRMKRKASVMWSSSSSTTTARLKVRNDVNSRRGRRDEGRNLRRGYFFCDETCYTLLSQDLGFKGLRCMVTSSCFTASATPFLSLVASMEALG